jgi:DNA mismatch repair protein MutS
MKRTPMMEQYLRIKAEHRDAILLYRLGDFYEMFFEDAKIASSILDITLTSRGRDDNGEAVPLCGVPYHAVQPYIARLLAAGWKVAVCEQRSPPGRGLVEREVVRVITQGTVLDEASLDPSTPSYLTAVAVGGDRWGLAVIEFTTGSIRATESPSWDILRAELQRLQVREVVVPPTIADAFRTQLENGPWTTSDGVADVDTDMEPPWRSTFPLAAEAAGRARAYVAANHRGTVDHLQEPEPYDCQAFLTLDATAQRNLELLATLDGQRRGSVLWVIDRTSTAMGARTLRGWLLAPLMDLEAIGARLDAVEELTLSVELRNTATDRLRGMGDLERIGGRIGTRTVSPRDLVALAAGLERVGQLVTALEAVQSPLLRQLACRLDPLESVRECIGRALLDEPPANLRHGLVIRGGYHAEVDELRQIGQDGRGWITQLEAQERERTGISSLKVRYNKVFGYYIEVSKPNLSLVPEEYQRKQTLVNGERFITPDLKAYEAKVLGADERLRALEVELFNAVVDLIVAEQGTLTATAQAAGQLDSLLSLAEVAHHRSYVRPHVHREVGVVIRDGRHPVVEALHSTASGFVPNDCEIAPDDGQIVVITGPNMAGKSTYLRQNALIVLLAQMGSFVPASEASVGLVDRIFTRVGASDNLAGGESTFMVEMRETAQILQAVTPRSLVILDEIGRGTSTFDGISIAWAVVEHLHDHATRRPLTLFATHYHELTDLPRSCARVRNASAAVREWKGEVVFLRRIVDGPASRSYGIEVARLAGVPTAVVARAKHILAALEAGGRGPNAVPERSAQAPTQGLLFEAAESRLRRELSGVDIDQLTPLEALNFVGHLVQVARSET